MRVRKEASLRALRGRSGLTRVRKEANLTLHRYELARPPVNKFAVVMHMLEHELFPHIGTDLYLKAIYLGYMVKKLLKCYLGEWSLDDRDSYVNKRIDTPGILLANLFRQYYAKTVKDMRNLILKDVVNWPWRATNKLVNVVTKNNVYKLIKPTVIESGLKYGLATGWFGVEPTQHPYRRRRRRRRAHL